MPSVAIMKIFTAFVLAALLNVAPSFGQGLPVSQLPRIPDLGSHPITQSIGKDPLVILQTFFSKIQSFEYISEHNRPNDPAYGKLVWKEDGDRFYYDLLTIFHPRHSEIHKIVSFDGKQSFVLEPVSGQLRIFNGLFGLNSANTFDTPLKPFSFILDDNKFLTMHALMSGPAIWQKLKSRLISTGFGNLMGRDCVIVRFKNSFLKDLNQNADYDVYFDRNSLIPVGWKAYDANGNLLQELEVLGTQDGFPSSYQVTTWQIVLIDGVQTVCHGTRTVSFGTLAVNTLSPDDVVIDPSLANTIYDTTLNQVIDIPK
jgi:hypothetical protein